MYKQMKTLSKRAKEKKGQCGPGYAKYRKALIMQDNRAHAGRWKRLRHANGILEKRTDSQKICGATGRRRRRKDKLVAVGGVVVVVADGEGVAAKVRATLL